MIFSGVDVLAVYSFLKTFFRMDTNLNDHITDDDTDEFGYDYREIMIAQFKQDLYNVNFSHQDEDKHDDGLHKRISFWLLYTVKEMDQYKKMFIIMIITVLK